MQPGKDQITTNANDNYSSVQSENSIEFSLITTNDKFISIIIQQIKWNKKLLTTYDYEFNNIRFISEQIINGSVDHLYAMENIFAIWKS